MEDGEQFEKLAERLKVGLQKFSLIAMGLNHDLDDAVSKLRKSLQKNDYEEIDNALTICQQLILKLGDVEVKVGGTSKPRQQTPSLLGKLLGDTPVIFEEEEAILEQVATFCVALVDLIEPAPDLKSEAQSLIKHLETPMVPPELKGNLNRVQRYVTESATYSNEKFEAFLALVGVRFEAINQFLSLVSDSENSAVSQEKVLDGDLRSHVHHLQDDLKKAKSLEEMDELVKTELNKVLFKLDKFKEKSLAREKDINNKLQAVKAELDGAKTQAANLKESLNESQARQGRDTLTDLPNQQGFSTWFHDAQKISERNDKMIALIDIDDFKVLNAKYGHAAGDKVLKKLANIFKGKIHNGNFVGRYEDDRFVVVIAGDHKADAQNLLNEVCTAVADTAFHFREEAVPVQVSIGIAPVQAKDTDMDAVEKAEKVLQKAKSSGKNQVAFGA